MDVSEKDMGNEETLRRPMASVNGALTHPVGPARAAAALVLQRGPAAPSWECMKTSLPLCLALVGAATLLCTGCTSQNADSRLTNRRQPGPAVGNAVGTVVGAVGSNAVGAVVGVGEGAAAATKATFDNERRVVRTWRTETTPDGRTIKVPVEVEVDEYGRPISQPKTP